MRNRFWLLAATILVSPCLRVAGAPDTLPSLPPETHSKLESWYRDAGGAKPGEAFGSYLARVAYLKHGVDYDDVVSPPGEETLRIDLDRFECVTFIESSLAVARCGYRGDPTADCFERELVLSRYRDGVLTDYASRLHYFADWIDDNGRRNRLQNLTRELGGEPVSREFFYVTRHLLRRAVVSGNELARLEREVADTESRLSEEPHLILTRESAPAALGKLEDGDSRRLRPRETRPSRESRGFHLLGERTTEASSRVELSPPGRRDPRRRDQLPLETSGTRRSDCRAPARPLNPRGGRLSEDRVAVSSVSRTRRRAPVVSGIRILVILVACTGATGKGASGPRHHSGWREVESPHFLVATDTSADDARELARQLERVRAVFRETTSSNVDPPERIVIFVSKNQNSLRKLLPKFDRRGVSFSTEFRQFMVLVGKQGGPNPYEVLYHEYIHQLNHLNYRRIPLWLDEGLATFFSYAFINGQDLERTVRPFRELLARESTIPLETFFTVDHSSPYYTEGPRVLRFYAQSWAMTHLILVGDATGELRRTLQDYLTLLDAYVDPGVSYRRTFGRIPELEPTLYNDVRKKFYYAQLAPTEEIDGKSFVVRDLTSAEWAARRGDFLLHLGRVEDARSLLEQALEEEPSLAEALTSMGILSYRQGDNERAMKYFDEALALGHDDYLVDYHRGLLIRDEDAEGTRTAEVEKSLARAVSLNPRFAPAYSALADLDSTDSRPEEALAMAYMAAELGPESTDSQLEVARLRNQNGQHSEGVKAAVRAVNLALQSDRGAVSNHVCWYGCLSGFPDIVLTACERAVALAPEDVRFRDSRGLARALTGDYRGAVEDFLVFSEGAGVTEEAKTERKAWVEALTGGRNPFDAATLERLRSRSRAQTKRPGGEGK